MQEFNPEELKRLYIPPADSHKGQNGRLLLIGGSHLFHSASLWALKIASRIVDMVFYSSVPENNEIVKIAKQEFRDGIVVPREQLENYIEEADCVLLGPGMVRTDNSKVKSQNSKTQVKIQNLKDVSKLEDEGEQTYHLTKYLLAKYPSKRWVIDAGALQMMEAEWLKGLNGNVVLTPHQKEFERLFENVILGTQSEAWRTPESTKGRDPGHPSTSLRVKARMTRKDNEYVLRVKEMAREYNCIILVKGHEDTVCSPEKCVKVTGGNPGMTKGGTGDVLAGLIAALACKNDLFLAAQAGSYINKKAGDSLYERVGPYFNASDLVDEIPKVMKDIVANR